MKNNIVVFYDPAFPYAGPRPDDAALQGLRERFTVTDARGLAVALHGADVLVHLHGPYVPKYAWPAMMKHVRGGKGLIAIGGAPFKIPVFEDDGDWRCEPEQTAYHQQLYIHEALPIDPSPIAKLRHHPDIPLFAGKESLFTIEPTYSLVLHVTRTDDRPGEGGSSGPMDAHIYPLLKGVGAGELEREAAAPAVLLEHTKGDYAGGRWLLVCQTVREPFWAQGGLDAIGEWAEFVARGVTELWLKSNYASYEPGDQATLMLQAQHTDRSLKHRQAGWTFRLQLWKGKAASVQAPVPSDAYAPELFDPVWETELTMEAGRELRHLRIPVPVRLEPGFYVTECEAVSDSGERRLLRHGFWGFDAELLKRGSMLTCDRDYFRKDGKPLPIVGMTYMTSDVARKFLQLPNAAVWDRDMARMKRAGINLIRTGIWTAWRSVMFIDGHPYEEVLRAIDAFILTAKRYDLEVTFNFFAFTPEAWEGVNPYLDPRSVEAQKRFIAAIVSRHADSTNVHWDLINEPSMFDPQCIFEGPRTCGDRFEREAYAEWLRQRHGDVRTLQERWNMTPEQLPSFEAAALPEPSGINFKTTEISEKKGAPWLDYTLFTMDMHNRWAAQLVETIRDIQPKQLITVGQDEALGAQRPSPFFYAKEVDYTTVHTWWNMDDLVWDGVFAKDAGKPNLIQETGIMYVETPDGRAKRSETELRNILERKYAYAFSTGGAGAVQWIWNTNFYMHNINESHIGALRADGTEKPEADVSYDFGAFMGQIGELFEGRELEETVVVFPYSNDFSNRKLAYESTTHAIRTLAYNLNVPVRGIGEYQLDSLSVCKPKLIIVPSPHNFSGAALERLLDHVQAYGGTLLFTGPIGLDEYWRPADRMSELLLAGDVTNVLREEALDIDGTLWPVSFGKSRIADSCRQRIASAPGAGTARIVETACGSGTVLWCPLPVELNKRTETLAALYRSALIKAGVSGELNWLAGADLPGVYGRKLTFTRGALFVFVSEYALPAEIEVSDPATGTSYAFTLESERSVLFACDPAGRVTAVYRPYEVTIASNYA